MPTLRHLAVAFTLAVGSLAALPPAAAETPDYAFLDADAPAGTRVPKFLFLFDEPASWPGTIAWRYNPAGAPAAFADTATAVSALQATLNKWTAVCGVSYSYQGTTTTAPDNRPGGNPDLLNVVGWGPLQGNTAGLTWAWYSNQGGVPSLVDGDIILSPTLVSTNAQMDRVATHEWGHLIGLAHSDMNGAAMSGPPYSSYNSLFAPTDDDVRGCRCLYGPASGQSAGYLCTLPRERAFGNVPVGATSAPSIITLTNDGNAAMTLQAPTFSSGGFAASGCAAGTVLAPGQGCDLSLTFSPTAQVGYAVAMSIPISGETQPYRVSLIGTGTAASGPAPTLSPTSASFGSQTVGTTSGASTLVLTNAGSGSVSITGFTPGGTHPGDFNRAGTCANGTTLGAGVSCSIQLTFTPTATGARSATLAVGLSAGSVPVIALSGSGTAPAAPPALGTSTAALAFADQPAGTSSTPQNVTVTNTGGGTLTISSIGFTGASAAEFTRSGCNPGTGLGASQSCTAAVRFAPSTAGAKTAALAIVTNAGSASVSLSGNAVAPPTAPVASLSPSSIDFGARPVGSPGAAVAATIANAGTAPLSIGAASIAGAHPGDFALLAACPVGTVLLPGQTCGYSLRFQPQAGGSRSAQLRVAHGASGSPATIALAGTGTLAASASTVVEYYHAAYDHYFITIGLDEIAGLDAGVFAGWSRSGLSFKAHATPQPGFAPICRFYLPPGYGDSHFYSASPAECAIVAAQNPAFKLETTAAMFLAIPDPVTGACPAGTDPVYRAWNRRLGDTNHRYTSIRAVRDAMVAMGYAAEGSGPDYVTFCAPR